MCNQNHESEVEDWKVVCVFKEPWGFWRMHERAQTQSLSLSAGLSSVCLPGPGNGTRVLRGRTLLPYGTWLFRVAVDSLLLCVCVILSPHPKANHPSFLLLWDCEMKGLGLAEFHLSSGLWVFSLGNKRSVFVGCFEWGQWPLQKHSHCSSLAYTEGYREGQYDHTHWNR